MIKKITVFSFILFFCGIAFCQEAEFDWQDLPMETIVIDPVRIEHSSFFVPAAKNGPFINRSCFPRKNLAMSSVLPATLDHKKAPKCPDQVARLLAENTSLYHQESLPLTIFNGWQWEYSYSLCQFESVGYELDRRGGSWENCWEAVLSSSCGTDSVQWLDVYSVDKYEPKADKNDSLSDSKINVITFSSMRIRDGYPKQRKL